MMPEENGREEPAQQMFSSGGHILTSACVSHSKRTWQQFDSRCDIDEGVKCDSS